MLKNYKGFTLIELLVVVLIIGILAAIALPQYRKAIEKSKASQGLIILKAVDQAFRDFYLVNGKYPTSFDELEISLPSNFDINENFIPNNQTYGKSNQDWNISFEKTVYKEIFMVRKSGKFQGAGFYIYYNNQYGAVPSNKILCLERKAGAIYKFNSDLLAGEFCEKVMGAKKLLIESYYARVYGM